MYVVHEEYTLATPYQPAYEDRVSGIHAIMAKQPGLVGAYVMRYLGNGSRYLAVRTWESREHAQAWSRNPDFRAYLSSRPPEMYSRPPMIEYYDRLPGGTQGEGKAGFVAEVACEVAGGHQAEFEAWQRDVADRCVGLKGFVERQSYKYLGNNSRYFWLSVWQSWDSFEAGVLDSPMGAYLREHPIRDLVSEPNVQRFYRVVDQR